MLHDSSVYILAVLPYPIASNSNCKIPHWNIMFVLTPTVWS